MSALAELVRALEVVGDPNELRRLVVLAAMHEGDDTAQVVTLEAKRLRLLRRIGIARKNKNGSEQAGAVRAAARYAAQIEQYAAEVAAIDDALRRPL